MVQRVRLLLIAILSLLGCSTEALKIHVPPTGVASVHQEDLRRAYWKLERGVNPQDWWNSRARQVHLSKTEIRDCFVHTGKSTGSVQPSSIMVIAEPLPIQLSMLASLAKAIDGVETPEDWRFCLASAQVPTDIETMIDPTTDSTIDLAQERLGNPRFVDVQFEQLEQRVRQILTERGMK